MKNVRLILGVLLLIYIGCSKDNEQSHAIIHAETYYVAANGNNANPGTLASPFATLQKAHDVALAGDTIYIRGGTYTLSSKINITHSGATGHFIFVFAYHGEVPVIEAISLSSGQAAFELISASWWYIKGLEIKNAPEEGLVLRGASNHNIIENNNVHHCGRLSQWGGKGISVWGTSASNLILNNDSHHNRDLLGGGDNADGFQCSTNGTGGNILRGNRAWRNSDDGFDMFNINDNTIDTDWLIENNYAYENGYYEDISGNLVAIGDGNGFKLGGMRSSTTSGSSGGHTVQNNLSWKNLTSGFDDNNSGLTQEQLTAGRARPLILYNNTAWDNPSSEAGNGNYVFWTNINHTIRNNLSFGLLGHIEPTASASFNSWDFPVTVNSSSFVSNDDACARGTRNADGSMPYCTFLRLVSGSGLIDKGTNVGIPYYGSSPDLGAFEYLP